MTAVAAANGADLLGDPAALTDGYSAAFIGAAVIAALGTVLAGLTLRTPSTAPEPTDPLGRRERQGACG